MRIFDVGINGPVLITVGTLVAGLAVVIIWVIIATSPPSDS